MNTMADGASERLVAQIGEALFGQPGLTLIELAEKVKGTQPSPAGQDVRAQFEAWMTDVAKIVVDSSDPYPAALEREYWRVWQAALAVRQPVPAAVKNSLTVGISAEWVLGYLATDAPEESREAIRNAFAEYAALSAARQPVGQEPVGYRWRHSAGEKWQYSDIPCGWEYEPLYAAPDGGAK